jgi:hypothetical protein
MEEGCMFNVSNFMLGSANVVLCALHNIAQKVHLLPMVSGLKPHLK